MSLDFNDAPRQQGFDLLPAGTLCKVYFTIRPGHVGPGGMLTQSKSSDAQYLDCEFAIVSEPQRGRKVWQNLTLVGAEAAKAINISAGFIRGMLNSARNIKPEDDSDQARSGRVIQSYTDLNGMEFAVRLGIQKGTNGYPDKNTISNAVEPGHKDYAEIMTGKTIMPEGMGGGSSASAPAAAPTWASSAPAQQPAQQPAQDLAATQMPAPAQQPPAPAPAPAPAQNGGVPSWAQ